MYNTNIRNIDMLNNYAKAKEFFKRKALPTWRKKKIWEDNERPLWGKYQHHYRIVEVDKGYELHLYNQIMARYHHPNANGLELRQYRESNSMTDKHFMDYVVGVAPNQTFRTTTGEMALVPVRGQLEDTELLFDKNNSLVVSGSKHTQLYRKVSLKEDRERNKEVRDFFKPFITVCMFRMPEYLERFLYDREKAVPFGYGAGVTYSERNELRDFYNCPDSDTVRDRAVDTLIHHSAQQAYDSITCKRIHARLQWKATAFSREHQIEMLTSNNELVTEKELEKALLDRMVRIVGKCVTGKEMIPKFCTPKEFPYSNNHVL